jgi:hypothetical protein
MRSRWTCTGTRWLHLHPDGDCYTVWHADTYIGRICPVACDWEYGDILWEPGLYPGAKQAARRLIPNLDS